MRKAISALSLCVLASSGLKAQDSLLAARKSSLFPLPVLGFSPEKGLEVGVAALYSYYGDKKDPSPFTRNSSASLLATFTTNKQFKLGLRTENWSRNNDWHV